MLLPALVLIVVVQGLWSPFGVTPVFTVPPDVPVLGGLNIFYVEGLLFGLSVCCRLLIPMLAFQLVFMTSEPTDIVLGLVRIGIPYRVAFLFSTTFRFVPLLFQELEGMKEAQRLRGIDLDGIGMVRKLVALARLLVPLDPDLPDQGAACRDRAAGESVQGHGRPHLPPSLAGDAVCRRKALRRGLLRDLRRGAGRPPRLRFRRIGPVTFPGARCNHRLRSAHLGDDRTPGEGLDDRRFFRGCRRLASARAF